MPPMITRRHVLACTFATGALAAADANGQESALLDPESVEARSLRFVSDAATVDVSANPAFKVGQRCDSCALFQGKATDTAGACPIFGGRRVPAGGWCSVWTARSG